MYPKVCLIALLSILATTAVGSAQEPPSVEPQAVAPDSPEQAAVRAVFHAYQEALVSGDGAAAAGLVDSGTLDYFEDIKSLALEGGEAEIRSRAFVDRLLIVTMRHELEATALESMTLEDLLHHAIEAGWIGKTSIRQLDVGEITVDADSAIGVPITGAGVAIGGDDTITYRFARENGEWKFRFSSLVESINALIGQLTEQMGADEDTLIFTLVQSISGRQVLPAVWSTPGGITEAEPAAPRPQPE